MRQQQVAGRGAVQRNGRSNGGSSSSPLSSAQGTARHGALTRAAGPAFSSHYSTAVGRPARLWWNWQRNSLKPYP